MPRPDFGAMAVIAAIFAVALATALSPASAPFAIADDKGKQGTRTDDKSKTEGVPARCARLIKAAERERCLRKGG